MERSRPSRKRLLPLFLEVACLVASPIHPTNAFLAPQSTSRRTGSRIWASTEAFDAHDSQLLQERLLHLRLNMMEEELQRPPNPELSPHDFCAKILQALVHNEHPLPDSGFRLLLRASTKSWRRALRHSVGAPRTADEESVASALGQAMGRPHNQFGIIVGEGERFDISFPTDPLDYADGTCWVECRLRDKVNDSLLAILGWSLQQRDSDGAWLVDKIDWQDFRDEFRPGIGREEWMRICG